MMDVLYRLGTEQKIHSKFHRLIWADHPWLCSSFCNGLLHSLRWLLPLHKGPWQRIHVRSPCYFYIILMGYLAKPVSMIVMKMALFTTLLMVVHQSFINAIEALVLVCWYEIWHVSWSAVVVHVGRFLIRKYTLMSLLLLRITQGRLALSPCFVIIEFFFFVYQLLRFDIFWGYTESLSWKYSCKHWVWIFDFSSKNLRQRYGS